MGFKLPLIEIDKIEREILSDNVQFIKNLLWHSNDAYTRSVVEYIVTSTNLDLPTRCTRIQSLWRDRFIGRILQAKSSRHAAEILQWIDSPEDAIALQNMVSSNGNTAECARFLRAMHENFFIYCKPKLLVRQGMKNASLADLVTFVAICYDSAEEDARRMVLDASVERLFI